MTKYTELNFMRTETLKSSKNEDINAHLAIIKPDAVKKNAVGDITEQ